MAPNGAGVFSSYGAQLNTHPPVVPNLKPEQLELNIPIVKLPIVLLVFPSTVRFPTTFKVEPGAVVPMPTLP